MTIYHHYTTIARTVLTTEQQLANQAQFTLPQILAQPNAWQAASLNIQGQTRSQTSEQAQLIQATDSTGQTLTAVASNLNSKIATTANATLVAHRTMESNLTQVQAQINTLTTRLETHIVTVTEN